LKLAPSLGDGETNVSPNTKESTDALKNECYEQPRPMPRIYVKTGPSDGARVKGDNYASQYRYQAPWKFWCKLEWIIDTQLKKLCDEALLEKEELRHSFKYDDFWWTVKQVEGTRVFRNTNYTMKMSLDEHNKSEQPPVTSLDELPDSHWWDDGESNVDTEIALVRTNEWWKQWDHFAINRLLSQKCKIDRIVPGSEGWLITLRYDGESNVDTEIALVRTNNWWSDHITINHLLLEGYEIDRIVPGQEGWLTTLRR